MPEFPLDIGFYESSSLALAAQNCINHYPQNPQTKGAISQGALFFTPGKESWTEITTGPGRGFVIFKGLLYVVIGGSFYKVTQNKIITKLGDIVGDSRVIIANNGVTICIQIPNGNGYFYDEENGLHRIVDPVYLDYQRQQGVTSVATKDGYFIFTTDKEFFLSSLVTENKGQNFDALDFSTAENKPDDIVLAAVIKNELHIPGVDTIELFQNTGGPGFPFQRINGATIDKGVAARHSFIEFDHTFVFLGGGRTEAIAIWQGSRGSVNKISTPAIDHAIQQYTQDEITGVYAWTYSEDGNYFVGFTFPDTTFVYDATTSAMQRRPVWHERRSDGSYWRVSHVMDVYGKNYVLDNVTGVIGILSRSITSEYGQDIAREFTGIYLYNNGLSFKIPYIELNTESGISGLQPSSAAQVELLISDDKGQSFISFGSRNLSTYQNYYTRQVWKKIGRFENSALLRFRTTGSDVINYINLQSQIIGER